MFNYFKNYPSNSLHVCCEDSPTDGLHMTIARSMTLTFTQGSQVRLKREYLFNLQYLGRHFSCCIQTWRDGRLIMHDLDLHSRSQMRLKLDYFFNLQYLGRHLS